MPVFKLSLKIIKKNIPTMAIYLVVLLAISIIVTNTISKEQEKFTSFDRVKEDIAFVSHEDTELVRGLKEDLSKLANFVELENYTNAWQDALYFRDVISIIQIPEGFTEDFMNNKEAKVDITNIPDSYSSIYIGMAVEQYLNTAKLYLSQGSEISEEELVRNVKEDLSITTDIRILDTGENSIYLNSSVYYFNFLAYSLLAVLIFGISSIMIVFKNPDIQMRNYSSPFSPIRMSIETIMGLSVFTLVAWIIMVGFHFILNPKFIYNTSSIYFILNSLVFTFTATGISFLIGSLIKNRDAINAVANIITLGTAFISGVFVSQELLGDSVLKIASFTPTYWYVKANNHIGSLAKFNQQTLRQPYKYMLIQAIFGILFFAIGIILTKIGTGGQVPRPKKGNNNNGK